MNKETQQHRALMHISRKIHEERNRQDELCGGVTHDDLNDPKDWLNALIRQLGLATGETVQDQPDLVRWERQMIRIMATAQAALESFYRHNPSRLERVAGRPEGSGF